LSKWSIILHILYHCPTPLSTLKVNRLVDLMVVTTLVVLAAVASIVLANSYKKFWRSMFKNGSALNITDTANFASAIDNSSNTPIVVEAVQVPTPSIEESQPIQQDVCTKPIETQADERVKQVEPSSNPEPPAQTASLEAEQQMKLPEEPKEAAPKTTSRATRRKRGAGRTRTTRRTRKKIVSEAQQATESQPSS